MTTSAGDLGPFTGLRLIHATPTVELFTGFERNGRRPVVLIALTEQAGRDPNWSAEFTDAVAKDATTLGPIDVPVHVSDLYGRRPWAASRIVPGRRGAERILAALPGVVPEGTDPSALLHRAPPGGPPQGQPPGPWPPPAVQITAHPGAPQGPAAYTAPAGHPSTNAAGPQLRPGGPPGQASGGQQSAPPQAGGPALASGPPAQVSVPGYHPAPGPTDRDSPTSVDADERPTAAIPLSQPAPPAPISGPAMALPTTPDPTNPSASTATEPPPPVTAEPTAPITVTGSPSAPSSASQPGTSQPGQPSAAPVAGGSPMAPPPDAHAEGAPKHGPLPPGAHNPTVPIPHAPPPTSGPVGPSQQRPPGGPGGPIGGNTGSFPLPQGLPPPRQPGRSSTRTVALVFAASLIVVVLTICGLATVFMMSGEDQDDGAVAGAPVPGTTASPAPSRNADQSDEADPPAYKKALPVIITGSVFDAGEQTDLIQRGGWPFAFRVPVGWFCDRAMVVDGANNDGVECRPPGRTNDSVVRVGIRDCDNPCDSETQDRMNRDIASGTLIEGDATTSYAELANPKDNVYSLFVSHFFGVDAGQPLRWQVIVQGASPHTDRAAIQKVANDIRTQTP